MSDGGTLSPLPSGGLVTVGGPGTNGDTIVRRLPDGRVRIEPPYDPAYYRQSDAGLYIDQDTGELIDESREALFPENAETPEREDEGQHVSQVEGNAQGEVIVDATAIPENPYLRRPDEDLLEWTQRIDNEYREAWNEDIVSPSQRNFIFQDINAAIANDADIIQNGYAYMQGIDPDFYHDPSSFGYSPEGTIRDYDYDSIGEAIQLNGMPFTRIGVDGQYYTIRPGDGIFQAGPPHYQLFEQTNGILYGERVREEGISAIPPVALAMAMMGGGRGSTSPRGVFYTPRPRGQQPAPQQPAQQQPNPPRTNPTTTGEPVSVANGEYLETWRDFVIPGTLPFDGARYMGLKLPLPDGYSSPLGPCQISAFDEVISNPRPGWLRLFQPDGTCVDFERPFNFLPSTNPSFPHLELKAPWLKQLRLKDRNLIKAFQQYPDGIYRLESIEDLNGHTQVFERDDTGLLERIAGPDGLTLSFANTSGGRRTAIILHGHEGEALHLSTYGYDIDGRMTSADCSFGMSVRYGWRAGEDLLGWWHDVSKISRTDFHYDAEGRVTSTDTTGIWHGDQFEYYPEIAENGRVTGGKTLYIPAEDHARGQVFEYDQAENVTAEIDALGGRTEFKFAPNGFKTATEDPNGNVEQTEYDAWGNVRRQTDAEGRETVYGWGPDGELHIVIDPEGNRQTYDHDDRANVIAERDAEGHETKLTRDDRGRVIVTEHPDGTTERQEWDDHNRLVSVTDTKGHVVRHEYDAFNRRISTTDPLGHVTRYRYGAGAGGFDTHSEVTRPDGVSVSRIYDASGNLTSVTDGEGRRWTYTYGAFGVLRQINDPGGGTLSLEHDSEGRLVSVTNANGARYIYERDVAGRVIAEEDFDGRRTVFERDPSGRIIEKTKPDGATLKYTYDKSDLLKRIDATAPDGTPEAPTRLWYDRRGLLAKAETGAALVVLRRDRCGRVISEKVNGKRIRSSYDARGRRIEAEIIATLEDEKGGLTRYVRDPLGAIVQIEANARDGYSDPTIITLQRDPLGRDIERVSGKFQLKQSFDPISQLLSQKAGLQGMSLSQTRLGTVYQRDTPSDRAISRLYEYDRAFAPVKIAESDGVETRLAHDANGQTTRVERIGPTKGIDDFDDPRLRGEAYNYDAARNLVGASTEVTPKLANGLSGDNHWQTSRGGVVQLATAPDGTRIATEHDACGRAVRRRVSRKGFRPREWRYVWDAHDRLIECRSPEPDGAYRLWRYGYDAFGRRVHKVCVARAGETRASDAEIGTAYLWDGDAMVAEAPLQANGAVAWDRAIHWLRGDDPHVVMARLGPTPTEAPWQAALRANEHLPRVVAPVHHVVTDHLGTPRELVASDGTLAWSASYTLWGAVRTSVEPEGAALRRIESPEPDLMPWRFPGQYADVETGLSYNRQRHYDPLTGQYMSPDPIGLAGGDRPQGYVASPLVWLDPLGLAAAGPVNFMGNRDGFFRNVSNRPRSDTDPNGQFDVVAHGNPMQIQIMRPQGPVNVDHRAASVLIRRSPGYREGQPIRLLSCSTGACSTGFSQNLSNRLGVPVQAPTDLLWAYPNGRMVVAPMLPGGGPNLNQIGGFRTFYPGGGRF